MKTLFSRGVLRGLLGVCLGSLLVLGPSCQKKEADKARTIKIGVLLPLSGDLAWLGEGMRNALEMARAEIPEDSRFHYELIYEDHASFVKSKVALSARKLIAADQVDALISLWSLAAHVVKPMAAQGQLAHLSYAWEPDIADGIYNFNLGTPVSKMTSLFIEELKKRKIRSVGLFDVKGAGYQFHTKTLIAALEKAGIPLAFRETFNPGTRDFRTIIAKAKSTNAEIVVLTASSPELDLLAQQIKEAAWKIPLTSLGSFEDTANQKIFEGCWYVTYLEPLDLLERYQARYQRKLPTNADNSYDCFRLLVHTCETGNWETKPSRRQIAEYLPKALASYDSIYGSLDLHSNGAIDVEHAQVNVIRDGVSVPAGATFQKTGL